MRTPTAIVTDLGTEFGVEVDKRGATTSHVFHGTVRMSAIDDKGAESHGTMLHADESARTERTDDAVQRTVVRRVAVNPERFARQLKTSLPVNVLAWFRMGEDEPNARAGEPAGEVLHCHNRKYSHLQRHGSPTYSADTAAPGSTLSMMFHGGNDGECFRSPRISFIPNDYFILEAWVKLRKPGSEIQIVVENGKPGSDGNGYCLAKIGGRWRFIFDGAGWIGAGDECEIGKWTHLALVCDRGCSRLWVNGQPTGEVTNRLPLAPDGPFIIGGDINHVERAFDGEIDEVRLSTFIGPFRPEMLLFHKTD